MSPKFKVCYSREDYPNKSFDAMIDKSFTLRQFLDYINKKYSAMYQYVWCDDSKCDLDDNVCDFFECSTTLITVAFSPDYAPPSYCPPSILTRYRGYDLPGPVAVVKPPEPVAVVKPPEPVAVVKPPEPVAVAKPEKDPDTIINLRNYIDTERIKRPQTTPGKIRIFITATPSLLLNGIEFEPDLNWNPNDCSDFVLKLIKDKFTLQKAQILLYLPGGIPFTSGTLADFFNSGVMKSQSVLYGVLTRSIKDAVLNKRYPEICNVSNQDHRLLLSPICDSTERGLVDIACLFGYLNHDGVNSDLLLKSLASVTRFPPLITAMNRIIERNDVIGRTVITVSGALFCYFQYMLPVTVKPEQVFEYGLRCCNIITHIKEVPEKLPMLSLLLHTTTSDATMNMFSKLKQPHTIYFWIGDTGEEFEYQHLIKPESYTIEKINSSITTFRPILPLSIRTATGASIVQGKDHNFLYLMQSSSKDAAHQNYIDIIDPLTGYTESKDVENFAKEQGILDKGNATNLIDLNDVKQLIMVCFDESGSMIRDIDGNRVRENARNEKVQRVTIAIQYLTTFANRIYGYRIPCIQGLISFNNEIKVRCPLSPLVPDFEDKGLRSVFPESTAHLWDAIQKSCEEIIAINKDPSDDGIIFKNAARRILVISAGDDYTSIAKPDEVARKLIENRITVDSVIISSEDTCKMLCALSHITGGLSFRPQTVNEGLSLFEQSAFLNIEERKPSIKPIISKDRTTIAPRIKPNMINSDFMDNACSQAEFDTEVINRRITEDERSCRLAFPSHVIYKNRTAIFPQPRKRRILRELHVAAEVNDKYNSIRFDPDLQILTNQLNIEKWRVYIKGPEGTPYANRWWHLLVTFPELYPFEPPIFRFVTIPYHLNISSDGRICLNIIEKGYISSKHVVDIIQEIKELFLFPCEETPIHIEIFDFFKHHRAMYDKLARQSAELEAKNSIDDYLSAIYLLDECPDDFKIEIDGDPIPPYMLSQISGKPFTRDKIMASTGVYYDKDELKQLIASNKKPICVITGKPLTETLEELDAI